jgi:hypothetical protein
VKEQYRAEKDPYPAFGLKQRLKQVWRWDRRQEPHDENGKPKQGAPRYERQ